MTPEQVENRPISISRSSAGSAPWDIASPDDNLAWSTVPTVSVMTSVLRFRCAPESHVSLAVAHQEPVVELAMRRTSYTKRAFHRG